MKRFFLVLALASVAACSTVPANQPTPQQIADGICPPIQTALTVLSVPGIVDPAVEADLAVATPIVAAACSPSAVADLSNISALANDAIPLLLKLVAASPDIPANDKTGILLGVKIAKALVDPLIAGK